MQRQQEPSAVQPAICLHLPVVGKAAALSGRVGIVSVHVMYMRQYPVGFGHRVASLLPKMGDGVQGLRVYKARLVQESFVHTYTRYIYIYMYTHVSADWRNSGMCKQNVQDADGASMDQIWSVMKEDSDLWQDAGMEEVVTYLRGAKALQVPHDVREALNMNA